MPTGAVGWASSVVDGDRVRSSWSRRAGHVAADDGSAGGVDTEPRVRAEAVEPPDVARSSWKVAVRTAGAAIAVQLPDQGILSDF